MTDEKLILRIFSGPHNGAEIPLNLNSEYIIGKDEECDFVLGDQSVSPKHIKIKILEKKISIEVLEGEVYVNAKKINKNQFDANFFDIITIGLTTFAIGQEGKRWAELKIPNLLDLQSNIEINDEPQILKEKIREKAQEKIDIKTESKKNITIGKFFISFFIIFLAIFFSSFFLIKNLKNNKTEKIDPFTAINENLIKLNFKNIQVFKNNNGIITIKGYVKDQNEKKKLMENSLIYSKNIIFDVFSETELLNAIKETLEIYGINLRIESNGEGFFTLYGVVENAQKLQEIILNIKNDIVGIKDINNKTVSANNIKRELEKMIANFDAKNAIKVDIIGGDFILSGYLNGEDLKKWNNFFTIFIENSVKDVKILNRVQSFDKIDENKKESYIKAEKNISLKIPILSVTIGNFSYINTTDGRKLFTGSYIGDGYKIKSIQNDFIILEKNNIEYIYPIKGGSLHDGQ